ncbi:MAG: tRNA epoxyqueuosine(34) reductase QueG, partial [bacterium]
MKSEIITTAKALGFALVGITTAKPVSEVGRLRGAIDGGRIGAMAWLGRNPEARCDPQSLLPGAKS